MRHLSNLIPKLTKSAFADRGFYAAAVLTDWPAIVGETLAARCCPEKLERDGTLTVRVASGFAVELQHQEPQVLDRIATYFGHRAVTRLALRQGPVGGPAEIAESPAPDPAAERFAAAATAAVESDRLRAALHRLGRAVHGSTNRPKSD